MKKILTIALALLLIFSLAACSSSKDTSKESSSKEYLQTNVNNKDANSDTAKDEDKNIVIATNDESSAADNTHTADNEETDNNNSENSDTQAEDNKNTEINDDANKPSSDPITEESPDADNTPIANNEKTEDNTADKGDTPAEDNTNTDIKEDTKEPSTEPIKEESNTQNDNNTDTKPSSNAEETPSNIPETKEPDNSYQQADIYSEPLVWTPVNGGTKYHTRSTCSNMKNPIQVTISTAVQRGFTPCKKCCY